MTDFPYISGVDVSSIENKEFARFETTKANHIVIALDKSNIPYSARFGDSEITLTYDGSYKEQVEEILAKIMSDGYEVLLREIGDRKNTDNYLKLLSEVADIMHTTVGSLKNRPDEVQIALCKTYADYWVCDTYTIQQALERIDSLNIETQNDIQEHERQAYQANNTPEKREQAEFDDTAHQMSVIKNMELYSVKPTRFTDIRRSRRWILRSRFMRAGSSPIPEPTASISAMTWNRRLLKSQSSVQHISAFHTHRI